MKASARSSLDSDTSRGNLHPAGGDLFDCLDHLGAGLWALDSEGEWAHPQDSAPEFESL